MNAFEYTSYVRMCAVELRSELNGTIPVLTSVVVLPKDKIKNMEDWNYYYRHVFCHPDDYGKEYVEDYAYPHREL
ncbi:hypothetical protein [Brevibacillus sp. NRS-1366]|uniref:hypothetical protein n=1 Tax=Brevibacillus sp. NRS-1366 TaxID=3233899 RepID=UPI003D1D935B